MHGFGGAEGVIGSFCNFMRSRLIDLLNFCISLALINARCICVLVFYQISVLINFEWEYQGPSIRSNRGTTMYAKSPK